MNVRTERFERGFFRRGRVLVVDHQPKDDSTIADVLTEHKVVFVSSGADALALIAVGRPYDLVLSGVMLRDMTGVELLSRLWFDHPDQAHRLVFMTPSGLPPLLSYLLDGVPNLCLEIPFDPEGLRALLDRRIRAPGTSWVA